MIYKMVKNSLLFLLLLSGCTFSFMTIRVEGVKTYNLMPIENRSSAILEPYFSEGINSVINKLTMWRWDNKSDLEIKVKVDSFSQDPVEYTETGEVLSYNYNLWTKVLCIKKGDTIMDNKIHLRKQWKNGDNDSDIFKDMGKDLANRILSKIGKDW